MDTPCPSNGHEVLHIEVPHLSKEGEGTPTPAEKILGEFMQVRLSDSDYAKLVEKHGETKTIDYINQLDRALADGRVKHRKNHRATVESWIQRDDKQAVAQQRPSVARKTLYQNFDSTRKYDFAELERMERKNRERQLRIDN